MSASSEGFEDLAASLRRAVEDSGLVVADVLRLSSPVPDLEAVRVELHGADDPSRVEVLRAYVTRPEVAFLATVGGRGVPLGRAATAPLASVPWPERPTEAPSNADYRHLLALDHIATTLPDLPDLPYLPDDASEVLFVAVHRVESTPGIVRAATTLLTDLDSGLPLEWALRHLDEARS